MLKTLHPFVSSTRFLFALLTLLLVHGCSHTSETKNLPLAVSEIETISLSVTENPPFVYELDEKQIEDYVNTWNEATSLGLLKAVPLFKLTLRSKKGENRHFRLGVNWIKEEGDQAFSTDHSDFWRLLMSSYEVSQSKLNSYTPLSFIDYWTQQYNTEEAHFNVISISPELPSNWITHTDIDKLMTMLDSKEKMGFLKNPISSFIPRDNYSEKGGVAALFIEAYRGNRSELFSTTSYYPRVNEDLNRDLKEWWKNTKNKDK